MVAEYMPAAVEADTSIVRATFTGELDVGVTELPGLKLQVAPVGNPEQLKLTVSEKEPAPVA
jgi:hypothetical protein